MATAGGPANPGGDPPPFEVEAYKQICEDFRQLNQVFWQAPVIIISITGGIGFAVASVDSFVLRAVLLFFAGLCNAAWAAVIWRLRNGVMKRLLLRKEFLERLYLPPTGSDRSRERVMTIFVALLAMVSAGCFLAIPFQQRLFNKAPSENKEGKEIIIQIGGGSERDNLEFRSKSKAIELDPKLSYKIYIAPYAEEAAAVRQDDRKANLRIQSAK